MLAIGWILSIMVQHVYAEEKVVCTLGDNLHISGTVKLAGQCRYLTTIRIDSSNTSLDCAGAVIDGEGKRSIGIEVESSGKPLTNIEIRNCVVVNARHRGISIGWSAPDRRKTESFDRGALYSVHPSDVRLTNVTVLRSGIVGIYVDDYVTDTLIYKSRVEESGGVGIYLEHSSVGTNIKDSAILHNGFALHREGISIDSSRNNIVSGSRIAGNYAGGIYVYRNCSEHLNEDPKQVLRWQSADKNLLEDNDISGGRTGIWIASRQSMDVSMMQCGNGYYAEGKHTLDSAKFNTISRNRIQNTDFGIIVEDDFNLIDGNVIKHVSNIAIKVGSVPREKYLGLPVKMVRLIGNRFENVHEKVIRVGNSDVEISPFIEPDD